MSSEGPIEGLMSDALGSSGSSSWLVMRIF